MVTIHRHPPPTAGRQFSAPLRRWRDATIVGLAIAWGSGLVLGVVGTLLWWCGR